MKNDLTGSFTIGFQGIILEAEGVKVYTSFLPIADGTIYIGSDDGNLYAIGRASRGGVRGKRKSPVGAK